MTPLVTQLPVLFALLFTAPAAAGGNHSLIAVSKSGLMHLDSNGTLLAWRPEAFQKWQTGHVATNPRNGTVCWVRKLGEDALKSGIALRCAALASLNQTWDLPLPLTIGVESVGYPRVPAFSLDWITENWFITVKEDLHLFRKDGFYRQGVRRSYVCDYQFDQCLQLDEIAAGLIGKYYAAYDISSRLLFRIRVDKLKYRLESMRLDGSGLHDLDTFIRDPSGLAVDPVRRHVYWLDRPAIYGNFTDLNRIDYDGQNMRRVKRIYDHHDIAAVDAVGGIAVVVRNDGQLASVINGDTGETTDLVSDTVKGEAIPALANVKDLLSVKIVSSDTQMDVENRCSDAGGGCQDFCIPTVVNNTAEASCFCPEGLQLVDLECRKRHPSYAVVVGADSLQAVDLQTEEVPTILSNLTDGTKVDVLSTVRTAWCSAKMRKVVRRRRRTRPGSRAAPWAVENDLLT